MKCSYIFVDCVRHSLHVYIFFTYISCSSQLLVVCSQVVPGCEAEEVLPGILRLKKIDLSKDRNLFLIRQDTVQRGHPEHWRWLEGNLFKAQMSGGHILNLCLEKHVFRLKMKMISFEQSFQIQKQLFLMLISFHTSSLTSAL